MAQHYRASPPPLQHPVPTHPAYIPDPPSTPVSPQGYQRFSSSPAPASQQQQPQQYLSPQFNGHVPAYTTPFQHSQSPQQQQQQQQHHDQHGQFHGQQPQQGRFPQPDFGAWGMSDPTAQFGLQLGQSAVAAGQEYVQRNFGGFFPTTHVKHHFNVSNSYVMKKLRLVLFPWTHKPWSRKVRRAEGGQTEWQSPREDINSPDLYIPLMALVTYILLVAVYYGLKQRFEPTLLGQSASRAIAVVIVEFVFLKAGCYLLNVQGSASAVDLVAYGGYKFVGVIITLITSFEFLHLGSTVYGLVFIYVFLANAFFLLRSLRSVVIPDSANINTPSHAGVVNPAQRRRRITFLFLEAVSQILYMGFLLRLGV